MSTTEEQFPAIAAIDIPGALEPPPRPPWYRRGWFLATVGVTVIVVASVIMDLPQNSTRATQASDDTALVKGINADITPCSYAVNESFTIYHDEVAGTLTSSDRAKVPGLLRDDQVGCSFTNQSIVDLANTEIGGTAAGRHLTQLVSDLTLWTSSDALIAIDEIINLYKTPGDPRALAALHKAEGELALDRAHSEADEAAASAILKAKLPVLDLPKLPTS